MKKLLSNLLIIMFWSILISAATMILLWYFVQKMQGTAETFAIAIFFISFVYILIGIINAIGRYKSIDSTTGDYSYQQAKTITIKTNSENGASWGYITNKFSRLSFTIFIVGIILINLGLFVSLNYEPNLAEIESEIPVVTINEKIIPVTLKSYVYSRLGSTYSYGDDSKSTIELAKEITPIIVAPESELVVKFEDKPDMAFIGHTKQRSGSDRWADDVIVLPKDEGRYIYTIHVDWKYTRADYLFVIQVKN